LVNGYFDNASKLKFCDSWLGVHSINFHE